MGLLIFFILLSNINQIRLDNVHLSIWVWLFCIFVSLTEFVSLVGNLEIQFSNELS